MGINVGRESGRRKRRKGRTILVVLGDADLGSAEDTSVEPEALALDVHNSTVIVGLGLGHEGGLVQVGVELLGLAIDQFAGVEALQTVSLKGVHEDVLGHLQASNEVEQVLVLLILGSGELLRGHGQQRAVKVINALEEVLGETLDSELAGAIHITLAALLLVAGIGNGSEVFVLRNVC